MRKISRIGLTLIIFGLLLGACNNAPVPTQDPAQAAATIAAQVEAQVSTRVAQAMANIEATQRAQPPPIPVIPTSGSIPTIAPLNLPTAALPGVATSVPCNPPPIPKGENYPDGTTVYLNTPFNKSWTLQNAGTCTWNANYKIKYLSGDSMGGPSSKAFGTTVTPGNSITLTLPMTAPSGTGLTRGYWGLYDDKDIFFGQVWVEIDVVKIAPTSSNFGVTKIRFYYPAPPNCIIYADITTNGPGQIKFHWIEDATSGSLRSQTYSAAGTVTSTWTMTAPGAHTMSIYVDQPNHAQFGVLPFTCP
jgi:hypothetical protein